MEIGDHYRLDHLGRVARRIVTDLRPESVLDAGCASGMLVEKLRELDVDARGVDASEEAIAGVDASVKEHTWHGSMTTPLERKYDLVICIDVLEHMAPADAEQAIENMCDATDRVLFSSSPSDYAEPTHVNVRAIEDWSAQFARQGFVRNLEFDASFINPWAALYERSHMLLPDVVRAYDRSWSQLRSEVRKLGEKVLELQSQVEQRDGPTAEENLRLRSEVLTARDNLIGHEARLGEARGKIKMLETELLRYQDAMADYAADYEEAKANAERLLNTRTGRLLRAWHGLRALLRPPPSR